MKSTISNPKISYSLLSILYLFTFALFGQSEKFKKSFFLSAGAYKPTVSTTLQINGQYGPGAIISLEDNLGFSAHPTVIRVEGTANFTKRSGMTLNFFNINRKNEWNIDRDVNIMDTTFRLGAKIGLYFNTTYLAASYKYAVFSHPEWEAGLSLGIRYLRVKTGLSVVTDNASGKTSSVDLPAPMPVFGVFGSAFMTNNLRVRYNFDYFAISLLGIRASVLDNRFGLEYYFIENLGIGASVNFLGYQLKELPLAQDFSGQIKYSCNGFSFYLTGKF